MIDINRSFNTEPVTASDVCDGIFKSKNITVHGNATIVKQTCPKLVSSVEQRKALEMMTIVEEKVYPIVSTRTANAQHGQSISLSLQKADESCCSVWACGMLTKELL